MESNQVITSNQPVEVNKATSNTDNVSQPVVGLQPKKTFPIKILAVILGILLLAVIGFMAFNFFGPKEEEVQSGEIVWWGLWEDDAVVVDLINEYQQANPGVTIKYVRQSKEDYRERLTNALVKGTGPDIFRFHNTWLPMFKSELDPMPASVYTPVDFATTFYPVMVSDLTMDTGIMGLPLEYDGLSLYVNEEIFEKSAKSYPTTWNELRQTARELTIKDNKGAITQSGVALGRTENVDHWPEILGLMMLQNGVDLIRPTGQLAEDALDFYSIFSSEDEVWDTTLPSSTVAFSSGKVAMYFGPSWRAFEIRLQNPNLKFKTIPMPQLPKTEANEPDVNYASYWVEGVSAKSKSKTVAWNFLKFLSSDENLEKMYNEASKYRMFGEPYPKQDMAPLLLNHPIIGSTIAGAKNAQTWFLQSKTWDGPTGINSQINKYFEDAVNYLNREDDSAKALQSVSSGVIQVLSQYGIRVR